MGYTNLVFDNLLIISAMVWLLSWLLIISIDKNKAVSKECL